MLNNKTGQRAGMALPCEMPRYRMTRDFVLGARQRVAPGPPEPESFMVTNPFALVRAKE